MALPNHDGDELDAGTPIAVQLLQRLDRADVDRSGVRAEMEQHRPSAMHTKIPGLAIGVEQFEIGRNVAGLGSVQPRDTSSFFDQMCDPEMSEVVLCHDVSNGTAEFRAMRVPHDHSP